LRTTNDSPEKPTAGSFVGYSDQRLKKDINSFSDGLTVLRQINPVTYKFNGIGGLDQTKTHIGVIAQQVQQVAPYCVGTSQLLIKQSDGSAFSSNIVSTINDSIQEYIVNVLNYNQDGLFYVMINSIKQLDSTVTALQQQLSGQRTGQQQNNANEGSKTYQVELSNKGEALLYQNEPNPFGEQTTIRFFIPDNAQNAVIIFYDQFGKVLKELPLESKGNGNIEVNSANLTSGIYSYSLSINGKVIDTKKMMKGQ
jgi:trimeric autotransporter adhesin